MTYMLHYTLHYRTCKYNHFAKNMTIMLKHAKNYGFGNTQIMFPGKHLPLYSMIIHFGHQLVTSPTYRWHGLRRGDREFAIFQYTIAGNGRLSVEGENYDISAGDAMLLHIPQDHLYYYPEDNTKPWEIVYIGLNGREILRCWRELEKENGPIARLSEASQSLNVLDSVFATPLETLRHSPFRVSGLAYQFMMALSEDLYPATPESQKGPSFIPTVIDYCLKHINEPLTVDDLAMVAGYSRYHFSRLFSQSQGMPPTAFLNDLRLKHAMRLLQTEPLSIKEIAERCGFEDVSYFCKIFRRVYGTSPGQFRKKGSTKD